MEPYRTDGTEVADVDYVSVLSIEPMDMEPCGCHSDAHAAYCGIGVSVLSIEPMDMERSQDATQSLS